MSREKIDFGLYAELAANGDATRVESLRRCLDSLERGQEYARREMETMRAAINHAERRIRRERFRLVFNVRADGGAQ